MFDYDQYKIIINGIFDYNTLNRLYTDNKMLVLIKEKYTRDVNHKCWINVQLDDTPKQYYTVAMKDSTSNNLIIMNNTKIIPVDPKISIEYLKEKVMQQYEILLEQYNTHTKS